MEIITSYETPNYYTISIITFFQLLRMMKQIIQQMLCIFPENKYPNIVLPRKLNTAANENIYLKCYSYSSMIFKYFLSEVNIYLKNDY